MESDPYKVTIYPAGHRVSRTHSAQVMLPGRAAPKCQVGAEDGSKLAGFGQSERWPPFAPRKPPRDEGVAENYMEGYLF